MPTVLLITVASIVSVAGILKSLMRLHEWYGFLRKTEESAAPHCPAGMDGTRCLIGEGKASTTEAMIHSKNII